MLNLLFAFYICLVPLLVYWAYNSEIIQHKKMERVEASAKKRERNKPVAALKLAANQRRHEAQVYQLKLSRKPEYYDVSQMMQRRVSYFPGTELTLITDQNKVQLETTAVS